MALSDPDSEDKFYPLIFREVPEEFRLKAKTELNETEENVKKGLEVLRECIRRENLPFSTEENFLMFFLRPAKFDFKKAEEKLSRFQKAWQRFTELLDLTTMERIRAVIESQIVGLLPFRDKQGRAVFHARANYWDKESFNMDDAAACMLGLCLFAAMYPLTTICGITYIDDAYIDSVYDYYPMFNGFRKVAPMANWMPFRFSRVDFVNEYALCRYLFLALKPLLPSKFRNRIWFHGVGFEALRRIYSPSMLPFEFGGTLGPLSPDSYRDKFLEFMEKLKFESKHSAQIIFSI